jgi:hypothetical protein
MSGTWRSYHLDPRVAPSLVVDDEGGAFGEALSKYEAATGSSPSHIGEGGQAETGIELSLIPGSQPAQGPIHTFGGQIPYPEES